MLGRDRLITAAVLLPLLAAGVVLLPAWGFALLIGAAAAAGAWELYRFHYRERLPLCAWVGCAGALAVVLAAPFQPALPVLAGAALLVLTARLLSGDGTENALADTGVAALGLVYVGLLLSHVVLLQAAPEGFRWVFYLMLVTWSGDAAAYYVGSTLGRTRLTAVSPNKTVEGTVGGLSASIAAAYAGMLFAPGLTRWDPLWIGLLLGILALFGDLVESQFKRGAGVKDSSNLIPAHGGMLDKLDAFLFTAPALYYYLRFLVWEA